VAAFFFEKIAKYKLKTANGENLIYRHTKA